MPGPFTRGMPARRAGALHEFDRTTSHQGRESKVRPKVMRTQRASAAALGALCASAAFVAVVVVRPGQSFELCAGGCMTRGIPGMEHVDRPVYEMHLGNTVSSYAQLSLCLEYLDR